MEFKSLDNIDDIFSFLTDNITDFPKNRIDSIIDTIKEKKLEILLQAKVPKEQFDFSEAKNYPVSAKKIVEIVNKNTQKKVSPFEVADFFGIKVNKIINTYDEDKLAYLDYKHESNEIEIFYKDFSGKGYENVNEFLVSHELGHLFNHFLLGTFFDDQSYTSFNHELMIENLRNAISKKNIANQNTLIASQILSKKRSLYNTSRAAFSTNKHFDNSFEIDADLFAFNLLFYPKEVPLTDVIAFRQVIKDFFKNLQ